MFAAEFDNRRVTTNACCFGVEIIFLLNYLDSEDAGWEICTFSPPQHSLVNSHSTPVGLQSSWHVFSLLILLPYASVHIWDPQQFLSSSHLAPIGRQQIGVLPESNGSQYGTNHFSPIDTCAQSNKVTLLALASSLIFYLTLNNFNKPNSNPFSITLQHGFASSDLHGSPSISHFGTHTYIVACTKLVNSN